jgi:hypothetical protein
MTGPRAWNHEATMTDQERAELISHLNVVLPGKI